jgi:hypothetical protein
MEPRDWAIRVDDIWNDLRTPHKDYRSYDFAGKLRGRVRYRMDSRPRVHCGTENVPQELLQLWFAGKPQCKAQLDFNLAWFLTFSCPLCRLAFGLPGVSVPKQVTYKGLTFDMQVPLSHIPQCLGSSLFLPPCHWRMG